MVYDVSQYILIKEIDFTTSKNNVIGYCSNHRYRNHINIGYNHKTNQLFELHKFFSLPLIESL